MEHITTIFDVEHSNGKVAPCYALVNAEGTTFVAVSVRDAQRLQGEGVAYMRSPARLTEAELRSPAREGTTFFAPDFPSL